LISALLRASEHSQTLNPSFPKTPLNPQASKEDVILSLRRLSKAAMGGAPRTTSAYRGVSLHMKGKWEARISVAGSKKYKYVLCVAILLYDQRACQLLRVCLLLLQTDPNPHLLNPLNPPTQVPRPP
jgi:hypothetical protein